MREPDGVRSTESDHFLNGEASGLELANGLGHRRRGRGGGRRGDDLEIRESRRPRRLGSKDHRR
ncbi:hypothetical protein Bca52824_019457 [Brassica carinata]|uniref:Uncharacterized protein n=1 Tax=Brassica carinata TaxID=52824 RepID=A0A8X7VT08_BRACI|nr:hypothetical protein Bca52824_019457 [Brassica carinata]